MGKNEKARLTACCFLKAVLSSFKALSHVSFAKRESQNAFWQAQRKLKSKMTGQGKRHVDYE